MAASMLIMVIFFDQFDTQAFLTGTEPKNNYEITDFETILVIAGMLAINWLYNIYFKRLVRFVNRKLKKNIEWENNSMG